MYSIVVVVESKAHGPSQNSSLESKRSCNRQLAEDRNSVVPQKPANQRKLDKLQEKKTLHSRDIRSLASSSASGMGICDGRMEKQS